MDSKFLFTNKKILLKLSCYFVVLVLMALGFSIPVSAKNNRDISISITKGTCQIERAGKMLKVQNNMSINSGDTLITNENSYVTVKLDSDKFLHLLGPTKVKIQAEGTADNSQTNVFVKSGIMATDVRNKLSDASYFHIFTPNTIMSIRGTKTLTIVYEDVINAIHTSSAVIEGSVNFKSIKVNKNGTIVSVSEVLSSGQGLSVELDHEEIISEEELLSMANGPDSHGEQSSGNAVSIKITHLEGDDITNNIDPSFLNDLQNNGFFQSTDTNTTPSQTDNNTNTTSTTSTNDAVQTTNQESGSTTTTTQDNSGQTTHEHTWDSGVVTTSPTCTQSGIKTYTCTMCGDTRTEEIPALNHDYHENIVDPYPIFDADNNFEQWHVGSDTTECSHCGDVTSQETILVQPEIIDSQNNTIHEISVGSFDNFPEGSTLEMFPVNDALGHFTVVSPPYDEEGNREIIDTTDLSWVDDSIPLEEINSGDTLWVHIDLPEAYKDTYESNIPIEVVEDSVSNQDIE